MHTLSFRKYYIRVALTIHYSSELKTRKKKGAKAAPYGKVFEDESGKLSIFKKVANRGYTYFMYVKNITKQFLWLGSCFAFMFLFPMSFEIFSE